MIVKTYKYDYNICTVADEEIFRKQCIALEKNIPNLQKEQLLEDVDGSQTQIYTLNSKEVTVHNSYYIGAVYVQSEVELTQYFK